MERADALGRKRPPSPAALLIIIFAAAFVVVLVASRKRAVEGGRPWHPLLCKVLADDSSGSSVREGREGVYVRFTFDRAADKSEMSKYTPVSR